MDQPSSIASLRDRINAVRVSGENRSCPTPLGVSLPMGQVHEWLSGEGEPDWLPSLGVLVGLAIAAFRQNAVHCLVWIGRVCWPCPLLLDPHPGVLAASIFIDPADDQSRLWVTDFALRSPVPVGVIADGRKFTIAHTRRLQLAAGVGGGLCLLARSSRERATPSAAATRWVVEPSSSSSERPRWTVAAIRNKHSPATEFRAVMEWDDAAGLVCASSVVAGRAGDAAVLAS